MNSLHPRSGKLEMIIGCMFSGKSSELINRIRQHQILGRNMIVINHACDTRYALDAIASHDQVMMKALHMRALKEVWELESYANVDVIFIEEGQFFEDLYDFVRETVDVHGKHVILCGLDGDYNRKPFQQVTDLIPFADIVDKKSALCIECRDGTVASFTKRIVQSNERTLIGNDDSYIPVCRYHYLDTK